MDGWIKIYRKLKDWEWYQDSNVVHVFIHLLLSAPFADTRKRGTAYKAGQIVTSLVLLAAELDKSYPTILRCIKILTESGAIDTKSTNKKTIITIRNFAKYQQDKAPCYKNDLEQDLEQPLYQSLEQTLEQPLQPYYNKNIKNNKNVKNNVSAEKSAPQPKTAKTIEEREADFMQKVADNGKNIYPDAMLRAFFNYWTEKNENGRKMRFEKEKVFDIKKRLATWASRESNNNFKSHGYGDSRNNPSSPDYVSTERIVAAGIAMAKAGM